MLKKVYFLNLNFKTYLMSFITCFTLSFCKKTIRYYKYKKSLKPTATLLSNQIRKTKVKVAN